MKNYYYRWVGISEAIRLWPTKKIIRTANVYNKVFWAAGRRKVSLFLEILLSTPVVWKFKVSLVKILVIYDNPQITKARSENFKPGIKEFTRLSMLVGISEAIRLWPTLLYTLNYLSMLIKNFCSTDPDPRSTEKLTTLLLKYVSFYTIPLKEESFVKIEKHDNHEISEKSPPGWALPYPEGI